MSMSNYLEGQLINATLGGTAWGVTNTPLTISLHQGDPGEATPANEVSGNNYARRSIAFTISTTGGTTTALNTADVSFPVASGNWGAAVTHFVVWGGSDPLYIGVFSPSQVINSGGQFIIKAETLEVVID